MRDAPGNLLLKAGDGAGWLLEWWDQGCGGFTPITSQHGDLSPVHPNLDVGIGIKPPQVLLSPYGQDSTGGWMGMGSSFQPHKHPRRWQDLPSKKQLKKSFIGQFKDSKQSCFPRGMSSVFPAATPLRVQMTSRESKRRRGCHAWTWHPEVGARSFPGSLVPELVSCHRIGMDSQPGLDLQPFPSASQKGVLGILQGCPWQNPPPFGVAWFIL